MPGDFCPSEERTAGLSTPLLKVSWELLYEAFLDKLLTKKMSPLLIWFLLFGQCLELKKMRRKGRTNSQHLSRTSVAENYAHTFHSLIHFTKQLLYMTRNDNIVTYLKI
jgi:hypothetical protein